MKEILRAGLKFASLKCSYKMPTINQAPPVFSKPLWARVQLPINLLMGAGEPLRDLRAELPWDQQDCSFGLPVPHTVHIQLSPLFGLNYVWLWAFHQE